MGYCAAVGAMILGWKRGGGRRRTPADGGRDRRDDL